MKIIATAALATALSATAHAAPAPTRTVLEQALECKKFNYSKFDADIKARNIPTDGAEYTLKAPIMVFGISVTKISVFREGGEDVFRAFIPGQPEKAVADRLGLKLKNGAYQKVMDNRASSVSTLEGTTVIACSVNNE